MSATNRNRRNEIEASKKLIRKLEKQIEIAQNEYDQAKARRDRLSKEHNDEDQESKSNRGPVAIHPLLRHQTRAAQHPTKKVAQFQTTTAIKPPERTMWQLIKQQFPEEADEATSVG